MNSVVNKYARFHDKQPCCITVLYTQGGGDAVTCSENEQEAYAQPGSFVPVKNCNQPIAVLYHTDYYAIIRSEKVTRRLTIQQKTAQHPYRNY